MYTLGELRHQKKKTTRDRQCQPWKMCGLFLDTINGVTIFSQDGHNEEIFFLAGEISRGID